MELSNRALMILLSAASAGIVVAKTSDANAEAVGGVSMPVLTPELAATLVGERPAVAISSEGHNIIVPNGGTWAGAVSESDIIPEAFLNHYQSVRLLLTSSNLAYLMGGLNNVVTTEAGNAFVPAHSYDFWGLQGITRSIVTDERPIVMHFDGAPPEVLSSLGVSASATLPYHRDYHDADRYESFEYANGSNWISFGRRYLLSDDEVKRLVIVNAHAGEGTIDPNRIYVIRYNSTDHDGTLDLYIGRGDLVWDVLVDCPDTGACIGTNGLPIGHLAVGSQYIDLPGPRRLRHPMIDRLDHPINILNPETGATEEFTDGVFIIPRDLYGVPLSHPATPAPLPPGVPAPACADGVDNDGDGLVDMADPGCTGPTDNDETNPAVPPAVPSYACSDGADNDGDGLIDAADPGCTGPTDNDETDPVAPAPPETQPIDASGTGIVPPESGPAPPETAHVPSETAPAPPEAGDHVVLPPLRLEDPRLYFGLRALALAGNYLPNTGGIGMLTFGGKLAPNHYLGGLLGGGYFGSSLTVDPGSRVGLPNPDDPHALIGYAHAEDRRTAGDLLLGLEYRARLAEWFQLAVGAGIDLLFVDSNRSVEELLTTQDGIVVDSNSYNVPGLGVTPMGFVTGGFDFRLHPRVSLDLRGICTFDAEGHVGGGGGAGLTVYFGDTEGYSSGGNSSEE